MRDIKEMQIPPWFLGCICATGGTHTLLSPVKFSLLARIVFYLNTKNDCGFTPVNPSWFGMMYDDCLPHSSRLI